MNHLNKGKAKFISLLALLLLLFSITMNYSASGFYVNDFHSFLTTDTIPVNKLDSQKTDFKNKADLLAVNINADTNLVIKTDTFLFRTSKEALDASVVYHADDSMVMDIPGKKIILYVKN